MAEKHKLGDIFLKRGVLTRAQLEQALAAQGTALLPLASTVLRLGLATEARVASALAEQFGVPSVQLSASTLSTDALSVIPQEVAAAHHVLPMAEIGGVLNLAIGNPMHQTLLDEVAFASGRAVLPFVAPRAILDEAIRGAYAARAEGAKVWKGRTAIEDDVHIEVVAPPPPMTAVPEAPAGMEISEATLDAFPSAPPPRTRRSTERPLVLAVDDEVEILDIIDKALTHRGMEVVRATRGREALDQLRAAQPDIVLLDAMLPEIHGFEICSQIKQSQQYQHIPVIIISAIYTGWNFVQDVKRIYKADDYITKPFRVMELVHRVEETLARSKGRPKSPEAEEAHKRAVAALKQAYEALRLGQNDLVLEAAQRAVAADPFESRGHFMLGTALYRAGRLYEAISEYERVVELAPNQFNALKNLAVLYERQGFRAKAVELWMRALEQSPSEPVRQTIKAHVIGLL